MIIRDDSSPVGSSSISSTCPQSEEERSLAFMLSPGHPLVTGEVSLIPQAMSPL